MRELRVVDAGLVPYALAAEWQSELHRRRREGEIGDVLLLLEHPHVYTLGRRFRREHLLYDDATLAARGIDLHECDRGGSVTYHGPGQLVGYPIVDLRKRPAADGEHEPMPDAVRYLRTLEEALIRGVRLAGVIAGRREGLTGVWVGQAKLASIGVHVSRGVSKHGFALNVSTDLSYFGGIVACGIDGVVVTSLEAILGRPVASREVAEAVALHLARLLHRRPVRGSLEDLGLAPAEASVQEPSSDVVDLAALRERRGGARPASPAAGGGQANEGAS